MKAPQHVRDELDKALIESDDVPEHIQHRICGLTADKKNLINAFVGVRYRGLSRSRQDEIKAAMLNDASMNDLELQDLQRRYRHLVEKESK